MISRTFLRTRPLIKLALAIIIAVGSPGSFAQVDQPETSSSFTQTITTPPTVSHQAEDPATRSALPDWAIASASLLFFATAVLFWIARARVRDWMLGVPARRPPLG